MKEYCIHGLIKEHCALCQGLIKGERGVCTHRSPPFGTSHYDIIAGEGARVLSSASSLHLPSLTKQKIEELARKALKEPRSEMGDMAICDWMEGIIYEHIHDTLVRLNRKHRLALYFPVSKIDAVILMCCRRALDHPPAEEQSIVTHFCKQTFYQVRKIFEDPARREEWMAEFPEDVLTAYKRKEPSPDFLYPLWSEIKLELDKQKRLSGVTHPVATWVAGERCRMHDEGRTYSHLSHRTPKVREKLRDYDSHRKRRFERIRKWVWGIVDKLYGKTT